MPTVSVIIPNYNREHLIGETLENLLNQTRPADEIIVVDDGSTDRSVEVIKSYGERIRVITQKNAGPATARNRGLQEATGEYIQFFDSDDLCSLNKLEAQADAITRTGADFAYGPWLQTRLKDGVAAYTDLLLQGQALPPTRPALSWFLREWVIVFQCCMFRRDLLDRVGHYRTDLMPTEDSELLFRMLKAGARPVHTPDTLVLYRLHDGGQISQGGMQNAKRVRDWLRYTQIVQSQLDGPGAAVAAADKQAWAVSVRDARRAFLALPEADQAGIDPGPEPSMGVNLMGEARRIQRGLRRRASGQDFAPVYAPSQITPAQADQIRALGYEPRFAG